MSWSGRDLHHETNRAALLQQERSLDDWITEATDSTRATRGFRLPTKTKKAVAKRPVKRMRPTRTPSFSRKGSEGKHTSWEDQISPTSRAQARRESSAAEFSRQLGAAHPGIGALATTLPEMEPGRGYLPQAEPASTQGWQTAKWKAQLDFLPFNPTSEIDLEHWFEDSAYKISSNGATAAVVIKVMQLISPPALRLILGTTLKEASTFQFVEDIADSIALKLFHGDGIVEEYEQQLFHRTPSNTVFSAFTEYRRMEETYIYLCRRRDREPILKSQQARMVAMKLLPEVVAQAIDLTHPEYPWGALELFSYALRVENSINKRNKNYTGRQVYQAEDMQVDPKPKGKKSPSRPCPSCNGAHWKSDCPHLRDRCRLCGQVGHISAACRNKVLQDTAGTRRVVAKPKQTGVQIETRFDNTTPSQLKTVQGVVGKILTTQEKDKAKARTKYAEKQLKLTGQPVQQAHERQVLATRVVNTYPTSSESLGDEEECDIMEEEAYIAYSISDDEDLPVIPKKRAKLMEVGININNQFTLASLDTGALIDLMSEEKAREFGIKVDDHIHPINIKNIHQKIEKSSLSKLTSISLDNINCVSVRFALMGANIPIIISLPTLQKLGAVLDVRAKTLTSNGTTYKCYTASEQTQQQPTDTSTLQQTAHKTVEQTVLGNVATWQVAMSEGEQKSAIKLLTKYSDLWFAPKAGKCTTVTMEVKVQGQPRRMAARPTPPHLRAELNKQIDDLLKAKVITSAPDCKWVSPCHLVPKPRSDKWRLVIDYRYINTLTVDDGYQIPNTSDLLIRMTNAKVFSLIDLNWGFWNVSLDEKSQQFTGFVVPERGVFTWKVMPFGLKVSPTIFQRAIEKALRHAIDAGNTSVYIDDIIIYTCSVPQHLKVLEHVLELLREGGFYINWAKAAFFRKELLYLGHIVSENKLMPDPKKIKGLVDATAPKDKRSLLSFCAAANYLRMYIARFSEIMEPLTRLTGKHTKFKWSDEQEKAFQLIKQELIDATYLTMPKWEHPFIIFTDASEVAVAAALAQVADNNTQLDYIAFSSKKLSPTQRNWSATERELYAIVWACEHFEQFIKGSRPLIYSDHKSLEHLTSLNSPKIKRWAMRLSEFNPLVTHISGENNNIADWLSRAVPEDDEDNGITEKMYAPNAWHAAHETEELFSLPKPQDMADESKRDEAELPPGTLDWYDNVAYGRKSRKIYIPKKYRVQLLLWFHTSRFGGHQGVTRTVNRLRKYVWWPNLQLSVVDFINACPVCNSLKPHRTLKEQMSTLNKPQLFQMVSMDYIGPRTYWASSHHILSIVDHYSRYMVTVVSPTTSALQAKEALQDHWVAKFGAPQAILTDRGTEFTAHVFRNYVTDELKAKLYYASVEYPQGNGINESSHRILETAIKTTPPRVDITFKGIVQHATMLYNITPNRKIGDTPASLVFGCDLHVPGLQDFEPTMSEEARLTYLRNYRGVIMLVKQLTEIEEIGDEQDNMQEKFKVGDVVTYRLTTSERVKHVHFSQEAKYSATRSFPQRVVKVTENNLILKPLWTQGKERSVPKLQCKLITTFIPELMREELQQLYPSMQWIEEQQKGSSQPQRPQDKRDEKREAATGSGTEEGPALKRRKRPNL
jgi:hypothetical protein